MERLVSGDSLLAIIPNGYKPIVVNAFKASSEKVMTAIEEFLGNFADFESTVTELPVANDINPLQAAEGETTRGSEAVRIFYPRRARRDNFIEEADGYWVHEDGINGYIIGENNRVHSSSERVFEGCLL